MPASRAPLTLHALAAPLTRIPGQGPVELDPVAIGTAVAAAAWLAEDTDGRAVPRNGRGLG